jgi:hypothetical protein
MWNKKSEEDQIGLEFLSRLKKIKKFNKNPYIISKNKSEYSMIFDDYKLIVTRIQSLEPRRLLLIFEFNAIKEFYYVKLESENDDFTEPLDCNPKIRGQIFDLLKWTFDNDQNMHREIERKERISKIKLGMNKASDLL